MHHGHLYGLGGAALRQRVKQVLGDLDLTERADDLVETLSGGLARRTELAHGLLHAPELLLLDEPSTGLDPGARRDFSQYLRELRDRAGVTVVLTTHYMEEAERATVSPCCTRARWWRSAPPTSSSEASAATSW